MFGFVSHAAHWASGSELIVCAVTSHCPGQTRLPRGRHLVDEKLNREQQVMAYVFATDPFEIC